MFGFKKSDSQLLFEDYVDGGNEMFDFSLDNFVVIIRRLKETPTEKLFYNLMMLPLTLY